ncbi:MAG: hypothetical protein Q4C10_05165 [Clostridia bacterium]|nr:hypothetical protein [Clostridia bacterium]
MTLNILAIFISLAMMLTGAGADGQPAEAARTMTLHDLSITYNDETVDVAPALRLGAYTDGEKAVFDFGLDVNGDALFPIQLGASEADGITALFVKSGIAARVSADALNALSEQASQMVQGLAEGENAELANFLMNEYVPAYAGLIEAVQDEAYRDQIQQKGNEIFAQIIDRGEGEAVTTTIEGEEYAVTRYSYAIESDKLAELIDTLYTSDDALNAYYQAMFKLYGMLPEESGLNGMTSFADLFAKTGLQMRMDVVEMLSDDGEVDVMDATMTVDMSAMVQQIAQAQQEAYEAEDGDDEPEENEEAEEPEEIEIPELPPMVFDIHSTKVGDWNTGRMSCDYEMDEGAVSITADSSITAEAMSFNMTMNVAEEGEQVAYIDMGANETSDEEGGAAYAVTFRVVDGHEADVLLALNGIREAKGTSTNTVMLTGMADGNSFTVSFDVDVTDAPIEDQANGHEAAVVIDDLSDEALNALGEDQGVQGALMQVLGSLTADAQKLTADESVQALMNLGSVVETEVENYDYDYNAENFDGEGDDYGDDYDYSEEVEDDGVLPYGMPEITWLPEGWSVSDTQVDTAYDWVDITLADANGEAAAYLMFYADNDHAENYVVGEDGSLVPVEGREVSISSIDEEMLSVTLNENGVFGNMSINTTGIDMETVGQIVAGIHF